MRVEHFGGYGEEVFGDKPGPRPEEKIQRNRAADDSSLKSAVKQTTGEGPKEDGSA